MKKRFLIALLLLTIFSTYNIKSKNNLFKNLYIEKIIIEGNKIIKEENIKKKLSFLYETNIFLLNTTNIKNKLKEIELLESYQIKRIYPRKIKIKIIEKKPIAVIQHMKKKKFFTDKDDTIDFFDLEKFQDLPFVFGDAKSFSVLHGNLKKINFPISQIKKFYLFESKRWDLLTAKNQLIKLPTKNYEISLKNFMNLNNQTVFGKYEIFDYRIKDQLILK